MRMFTKSSLQTLPVLALSKKCIFSESTKIKIILTLTQHYLNLGRVSNISLQSSYLRYEAHSCNLSFPVNLFCMTWHSCFTRAGGVRSSVARSTSSVSGCSVWRRHIALLTPEAEVTVHLLLVKSPIGISSEFFGGWKRKEKISNFRIKINYASIQFPKQLHLKNCSCTHARNTMLSLWRSASIFPNII